MTKPYITYGLLQLSRFGSLPLPLYHPSHQAELGARELTSMINSNTDVTGTQSDVKKTPEVHVNNSKTEVSVCETDVRKIEVDAKITINEGDTKVLIKDNQLNAQLGINNFDTSVGT